MAELSNTVALGIFWPESREKDNTLLLDDMASADQLTSMWC